MREIDTAIIHCSATKPSMNIGAADIRTWHLDRGFSDIGYHYVIRRDGSVDQGRSVGLPGAHAKGHNKKSIGLCLVGGVDENNKPESNFTKKQWATLSSLVNDLCDFHPIEKVIGHNEISDKACPCFNVSEWWGE